MANAASPSLFDKARRVYREEGLANLVRKSYDYVAPELTNPRYGARVLTNKDLLVGHVRKEVFRNANQRYHTFRYPVEEGTNPFYRDWDNLIVLDACRYDYFAEMNTLEGDLNKVESVASRSPKFMERCFEGETYHDTVYISANAHTATYSNGVFHDVVNVWQDGEWDEEADTILPGEVTRAALEAAETHPDKRLCIHYMQPHSPYIGATGHELRASDRWDEWVELSGQENPNFLPGIELNGIDVTPEEMRTMYRENLEIVLEEVESLLDGISGKTVISADHGELLGETVGPVPIRVYGHPQLYRPELREVPWFAIDDERRETTAEPPATSTEVDEDEAKRQLEALGYIN